MANEVYLHTHGSLASMVSARAASRVLEQALRKAGTTPSHVSATEMRTLLLGPILSELETILPRAGLKRNLKALGRELRRSAASAARDPVPDSESGALDRAATDTAAVATGARASAATVSAPASAPAANVDAVPVFEQPISEQHVSGQPESGPAGAGGAVPELQPSATDSELARSRLADLELDDDALARASMRFAKLDGVTFVAAVRRGGAVVFSRGAGVDIAALARVSYSCLALTGRHAPLRSYTLVFDRGQLFLVPIGADLITVIGSSQLNLGAVFTALAALEEEL